jgi:methylmalonyl-CoA/ethylmalonyl-CoA epimerase
VTIRAEFDHVAVAAESRSVLEACYVGQLGGQARAGSTSPGFDWVQLQYANGMSLEMLQPRRVEESDFLHRFLDRHGAGPHHLTFEVPNFESALADARAAGYDPAFVNVTDPNWKEAFLHPKQASGIVVQLAESRYPATRLPPPERTAAALVHVGHALPELDDGLRLFAGLLGGRRIGQGRGSGYRWVDVGWAGPGRLRLMAPEGPGALHDWLDGRPGRLHHVAFSLADPERVTAAVPRDGHWLVRPRDNWGTRLVLFDDAELAARPVSL